MEILDSFEFKANDSVDWLMMADGRIYKLVSGVDYSSKTNSMKVQVYTKAKEFGMKVKISEFKDKVAGVETGTEGLVIQFVGLKPTEVLKEWVKTLDIVDGESVLGRVPENIIKIIESL